MFPRGETFEYRLGQAPDSPQNAGCDKEDCFMEEIPDECDLVKDQMHHVTGEPGGGNSPILTWKGMRLRSYTCARRAGRAPHLRATATPRSSPRPLASPAD